MGIETNLSNEVKGVGKTKTSTAKAVMNQKERFLAKRARRKIAVPMKPVVSTKLCWPQKLPVAGWPKKEGVNMVINCDQGKVVFSSLNSDEANSREASW